MVILSYNGQLTIPEEVFDTILKDLTALTEHRVILFPNLSGMHKRSESFLDSIDEDEWPSSKIRLIDEFTTKYR